VVILAAVLVIAVFTTRIVGLGRGKPVFLYNFLDLKRTSWSGPELSAGKHTIVFDFKSDGPELGKGGTGVLSVDGREVDKKSIEHGTPVTFPEDESFDIGRDTRTGVALLEYRYDPPFKFNGKIDKVTFDLKPQQTAQNDPRQLPGSVDNVAHVKDQVASQR
jgi:arylsulfatase